MTKIICAESKFKTKEQTREISIDKMAKFLKKNSISHEIIDRTIHKFVKPYFDIDVDEFHDRFDEIKKDKKKFLNICCNTISNHFKCKKKDMAISETLRDTKISYHIIIHNKQVNNIELEKYMKENVDEFKNLYFDLSIYCKYQKFRFITCHKVKQTECNKALSHKKDITKHFVTNIEDTFDLINLEFKKIEIAKEDEVEVENKNEVEFIDNNEQCNIETINNLLSCINVNNITDGREWFNIGQCLHNIDTKLIDTFKNWSKSSEHYDEEGLENKWNLMKRSSLNIGYLYNLAKKYNKVKYDDIIFKKNLLDCVMSSSDDSYAKILYSLYKNTLICSQEEPRQIWFLYDEGIWKRMDGKSQLRKIFATTIYKKILNFKKEFKKMVDKAQQERDTDPAKDILYSTTYKAYGKVLKNCKTCMCVTRFINQAVHYFSDFKFMDKLNSNKNIICFGKDIYDLKKCEWRQTRKDDYCSVCTGYDKDEVNDKYEKVLLKILSDIFQDEEQYEYVMNNLCELLSGYNKKEVFHIWCGTGANGKSLLSCYLKETFGEYYATLPISLITSARSKADQANPQVAKARYSRVAVFQEPEPDVKLNNALMKEMSGGDPISCRELYGAPFDFIPQYKCIILVNEFELQDCSDDSIPRRLIFSKFKSSFVEDPTLKFQKKRDNELKDDDFIDKIKGSFMHILIKQWNKLAKINFKYKIPKNILEDKMEFLDDNDVVKSFIKETVELTENKKDYVTLKQLYENYQEFSKDTGSKKMKKKVFKQRCCKQLPEFKKKYKPLVNGKKKELTNVFMNCKLRDDDDDDDNEYLFK